MDEFEVSWRKIWEILAVVSIIGLLSIRLESVPSLWWDEGWTLSVARNWVERGHYGHLRSGEPYTAGLAAAPPVVEPIALSFRLFGVGIWQGRLPGVVSTLAALGLIFYLAKQLYNRKIAWGAVGVLLLMTTGPHLNPFLVGRQALGEMPVMAYLLGGYTLLLLALKRSGWMVIPAALLWGIALKAKAQVPPFWLASMLVPLVAALIKRWRRQAMLLLAGMIGGWLAGIGVERMQGLILAGHVLHGEALDGLLGVSALVPNLRVRWLAVKNALAFGLPTLIGLGYAGRKAVGKCLKREEREPNVEVLRLALLSLAGSWLAWYLFLGMWWTRYLFPPIFLGGMFAAYFLFEVTGGYRVRETFKEASAMILKRKLDPEAVGALLGILLVALTLPLAVLALVLSFMSRVGQPTVAATAYLQANGGANAVIETYDSELLFLSDLRFHYPPEQISVELQRRDELEPDLAIEYDALDADPDYLVVGPFSEKWELYDQVLEAGEFRLVHTVPNYKIYGRVRP